MQASNKSSPSSSPVAERKKNAKTEERKKVISSDKFDSEVGDQNDASKWLTTPNQDIVSTLREVLRARKKNQKDLAREIRVSPATISSYFKAKTRMKGWSRLEKKLLDWIKNGAGIDAANHSSIESMSDNGSNPSDEEGSFSVHSEPSSPLDSPLPIRSQTPQPSHELSNPPLDINNFYDSDEPSFQYYPPANDALESYFYQYPRAISPIQEIGFGFDNQHHNSQYDSSFHYHSNTPVPAFQQIKVDDFVQFVNNRLSYMSPL
jgi:transcriptional regulator with XRE-family HTH domain